jgi:hypothetical protein
MLPGQIDRYSGWLGVEGLGVSSASRIFAGSSRAGVVHLDQANDGADLGGCDAADKGEDDTA